MTLTQLPLFSFMTTIPISEVSVDMFPVKVFHLQPRHALAFIMPDDQFDTLCEVPPEQ